MLQLSEAIGVMLPVLYLSVTFIYGFIFFGEFRELELKTPVILTVLLGIHGVELVLKGMTLGIVPFSTLLDAFSFWAFSLTAVYFFIELTVRVKSTGLFVLIPAFFLQLLSSLFYDWHHTPNPMLTNPIFMVHVIFTIIGYTAICVSSLYSLLYIMLNQNIKHHRFGRVYDKLPSLSTLERLGMRSVQVGIVLLGFGIILGHLRAGSLLDSYWPSDPKVWLTDMIWICYLLGYGIARLKNWRGRWMAYLSLFSFAGLVLITVTVFFLLDSFHHFN